MGNDYDPAKKAANARRYAAKHLRLRPGEVRGFGALSQRWSAAVRSQGEVAELLGVSRQCVQQCERNALSKLRRALREYAIQAGMIV